MSRGVHPYRCCKLLRISFEIRSTFNAHPTARVCKSPWIDSYWFTGTYVLYYFYCWTHRGIAAKSVPVVHVLRSALATGDLKKVVKRYF